MRLKVRDNRVDDRLMAKISILIKIKTYSEPIAPIAAEPLNQKTPSRTQETFLYQNYAEVRTAGTTARALS